MELQKRRLKILLIEDNRDFVFIMEEVFEQWGYETSVAYNGSDGIKVAKEKKPDVIICDIGLPVMNGFEVAGCIKEDFELKDIYLIALTGYAGQRDMDLCRESGFNRHLAKPIDLNLLFNILSEINTNRQQEFI